MTSRSEFLAQDRELVARMSEVRGRIEDMRAVDRVWMLGALTGALERHLAWAGGEVTVKVPRIYLAAHGLKPAELPRLAEQYGFEEGQPR